MAKEKIVIIGGGSAYVPGILYSLAHTEEILSGSEVSWWNRKSTNG